LSQDTKKDQDNKWLGDPTEIALVEYVEKKYADPEIKRVLRKFERKAELPFDSDRKRMTTIHTYENKYIAFSKGAAESIVTLLQNKGDTGKILKETSELAHEGMRVLAYGYKVLEKIPESVKPEEVEKDFNYIGLAGLVDPPREEAKKAIQECKTAGIQPVMITGDHQETAAAIAKEIGILEPTDLIFSGTELKKLSKEELDNKVEKIKVYARVSPEQKMDIVKSLQRKKHFVAMTGDGVNDAPSLKRADIGIAMGITGTDVSKESSDMILLDDNFATIVRAIKEGRRIYDNIRKFVKYIMTCNSAEIWTIFLAPLIGLPVPLLPVHILWINLVTDGLPGLALSAEKAEKNIMQRPPRRTDESLFAEGTGYHILWVGLLMAFITLGIQGWAIQTDNARWQTMVFTVLSLAQLGHVVAIRSSDEFIFKLGLFTNPQLFISILGTFCLQLGIIYLPFANEIFNTQPLSLIELLISIGAASIIFHAVELEKWVKKKLKTR
ncbi:MAG TPA: cation-translocating P-type ATPase, partial [Chitinophagaceae bacterium]|nr:cation-translocating P-type ATPase [Chitinophagaceae bacterium]